MSQELLDIEYMKIAIKEAARGLGFTSPNPMVGAVVVKNGKVISTGFHEYDGAAHAEVNALSKLGDNDAIGATIYVNLEPCCHFGRTPPCTNSLIKAQIARVVVANTDPDPRVAGRGLDVLRQHGIEVVTGVCKDQGLQLNSVYFFNRLNKRPYVLLKAALTLDGRIAAISGDAKWISNEKSREISHALRRRMKAIAVGKNTVHTDKPSLNCRLPGFENKPIDKLIFASNASEIEHELEHLKTFPGRVFLLSKKEIETAQSFYDFCNANSIDSVMVEGGGKLTGTFLQKGLVDRIMLFYKPSFLGSDGIPVANLLGNQKIRDLVEYKINEVKVVDDNIFVDLYKEEAICLLG